MVSKTRPGVSLTARVCGSAKNSVYPGQGPQGEDAAGRNDLNGKTSGDALPKTDKDEAARDDDNHVATGT